MSPPPSPPSPVARRLLTRSFQAPPADAPVAAIDDEQIVRLTVVLKPRVPYDMRHDMTGRGLSTQQFHDQHRTDQVAIDRMTQFASAQGLTVEQIDADHHTITLSGPMGRARSAFQPEQIGVFRAGDRRFIARSGRLSAPAHIADDVVTVLGFDQRPVVQPYVRTNAPGAVAAGAPPTTSYNPTEIAKAYNFPDCDGKGQTIALLEFGGGYVQGQIDDYFQHQHVTRKGQITPINLHREGDDTGNKLDSGRGDSEVQMDIEIAGAVAPGADISVYFAPNTAQGFFAAVKRAIDDKVTVISISWGNPENKWNQSDRDGLDQLFRSAQKEIAICVASGDSGSQDDPASSNPTVDFPASSQNVLACGGTSCPRNKPEVAWSGSGGGFSVAFDIPTYQGDPSDSSGPRKRGVPDLAANADPLTGYNLEVNGTPVVLGGTSAAAPLCAALIALINQKLGRNVGFINVDLYQQPDVAVDITSGRNGFFNAVGGWDPVTGLGTPNGVKIFELLQSSAAGQG